MKCNLTQEQMTLTDRIAIETGICHKDSFRKIALFLHRHPTTISHEVKENRTFLPGSYFLGKDCHFVRKCKEQHICGDSECAMNCCRCRVIDCRTKCPRYRSTACHRFEKPPYVCNTCPDKKLCSKDRFFYSAKHAQASVDRRRSESRKGFQITEEQQQDLDALLTKLVKKGQPLTHIYATHKDEIPVSLRSLYTYIDSGKLTIRNIDLQRKTSYKPRKKGREPKQGFQKQEFRKGRTYDDFEKAMKVSFCDADVVEMDTVKGVRETGKRLLTMIFRKNSVMLLFLMPDGKAESVKRVFDYLEVGLGLDVFRRLFPVILTDNGSEFKHVDDLEYSGELEYRTGIFYCDPMASWQKAHIEKNHEFIRYAIPKGKSLNCYTQKDISLLMNHINSTTRPSLNNKSPYDLLLQEGTEDDFALWDFLQMQHIPPDEVHLAPDLFSSQT